MWRLTHWKRPCSWEWLKAGGEAGDRGWDGGWHHQLSGHEFKQTLGDAEGQRSLVYGSPWVCRVRHNWATEQQQLMIWMLKHSDNSLWSLRSMTFDECEYTSWKTKVIKFNIILEENKHTKSECWCPLCTLGVLVCQRRVLNNNTHSTHMSSGAGHIWGNSASSFQF